MERTISARFRRGLDAVLDLSSYRVLLGLLTGGMLQGDDLAPAKPVALAMPNPTAPSDRIPPILFQTWKSRSDIPRNFFYWRDTFIQKCPEFQVVLWNDADNRALIEEHYPWFLERYDRYPREIFRADIIRLFFLYRFGGVYVDMDTECLRPLDDLRDQGDVVLGRMGHDPDFEHSLPNAILASKPRQAFWLVAVALAIRAQEALDRDMLSKAGPEQLTGPILIKRAYDVYEETSEAELRAFLRETLGIHYDETADFGEVTVLKNTAFYPYPGRISCIDG